MFASHCGSRCDALSNREKPVSGIRRWLPVGVTILMGIGLFACSMFQPGSTQQPDSVTEIAASQVVAKQVANQRQKESEGTVDAERAFGYLVDVCRIGPRISGTEGMAKQQKLLAEHFVKFGADVKFQPFDAAHPLTGEPVRMNNILISWHPEAKSRVLLACHYDTRPFPDREVLPSSRRKPFIGANDGASGVALFMEFAHHMAKLKPTYGVDFLFFDGEELVFDKQGKYFLGSEYFSQQYRDRPPEHRYIYGVLVDMIADRNLTLNYEKNSVKFAPELAKSIWDTARRLGVKEFVPRVRYEIQDDHLSMNEIGRIPTVDLIDFDYRYWHTAKDIPANCSGESLAKVGNVLLTWLTEVPPPK